MNSKKEIEDTTPEFASEILRRLTFHFIRPKESKKRSLEDTNVILAALNKSMMLVEKQIPKKVKGISITHEGYVGNCPACNKFIRQLENKHYCNHKGCGQAISWEE